MRTTLLAVLLLAACDGSNTSPDTAAASADSGSTGQGSDETDSSGDGDDPGADEEPDLKNGYYLFVDHCADCHGEDGQSGEAPNLQGRVSRYDDAELMEIILEGRGKMPGRELTEDEQVDLLAYLRMAFP